MFNLGLRGISIPEVDQRALKRALEEALRLLDLKLTYAQEQLFPTSSNSRFVLVHAAIRGVIRRDPLPAIGDISFESPLTLPAKTRLFSDDGREYQTKYPITNAASATVESVGTGFEQNLPPGTVLTLLSPVGFVSSAAVTDPGLVGGSDIESIESVRQRTIERWRAPAEYGKPDNYYQWIGETRAVKAGIFPAYPVPGFVSWSALVPKAGGGFVTPTPEIETEITAALDKKRPPGSKIAFVRDSKITLINLTIKTRTALTADTQALLREILSKLFSDRAFAFGAAGFEDKAPISDNTIRLAIFQALGDGNPFELSPQPTGKLGAKTLGIGEYLLLGTVSFAQ
jgi:uncharacterized phage protein gp47/JayE